MQMKTKLLNGTWNLKILGKDAGLTGEAGLPAEVPGSVYATLLTEGKIEDPYYRDNELKTLPIMDNDFCYTTRFEVEPEWFSMDGLFLRFDGIDTLADIYVNRQLLGSAYNMHRSWEYDLLDGDLLKEGVNELQVILHSPTQYIKEENAKVYTGGSHEAMEGFPHLRKAHCMFGWDWGPRVPDAGIYREVSLVGVEKSRIESVYITQIHEEGSVTLDFDIAVETFTDQPEGTLAIQVTSPDGKTYTYEERGEGAEEQFRIAITDPKLWWPHGYGDQPLYQVEVSLLSEDGKVLDFWKRRIGLRTITVNTDQDEWGNCFAHEVNGVKIFAMGADYIPEDNLLSRVTKERTGKLLRDAVWANHNCIRVWGGGYYPEDFFFDLCDELGLLVWQDFMYACASYELDDEFERNIIAETIENVRRIRHHACLALWCGNNEMETQTLDGIWLTTAKQKADYTKIYEYIVPKICKAEDPATFYWPSSPSSGGSYDNPWDEARGDAHYWDVWHGEKPFTDYRKYHFRYLSEFGFQSFPSLKTVESFTLPEERNIFSRVMEMHQRNTAANGKILKYLSATYLYPKDFAHLLYASQLLQADAIRYGVEHFRRYRGRCMGAVVWQLNDIWPVASWASIDYYGRWKALHYAERKMFAPVMISCEETGELSERPYCIAEPKPIEKSGTLHVANETFEAVTGIVRWSLRDSESKVLESGEETVTVPALDGVWLEKKDFSSYDEREIHMTYSFIVDGKAVSENTCLFTAPKHYYFKNPNLSLKQEGSRITVTADAYAKNVELYDESGDVRFSDNYFDMDAGEYTVEIIEGTPENLKCRSVFDIA